MPIQAAILIFGGLGAAAFFLYLLNKHFPSRVEILTPDGKVDPAFHKKDEPPADWKDTKAYEAGFVIGMASTMPGMMPAAVAVAVTHAEEDK